MKMKQYLLAATIVSAVAMTRKEYSDYRGWDLPEGENPDDKGWFIEEEPNDVIEPNHSEHRGYVRWIPHYVFESLYQTFSGNMSFSQALDAIKQGNRVQRKGWNGKNMFIFLVNGSTFTVNREPLLSILGEGTEVNYHGHIDMRTADGMIVPWLCSQTDMLANDWQVI